MYIPIDVYYQISRRLMLLNQIINYLRYGNINYANINSTTGTSLHYIITYCNRYECFSYI